MNDYELFLKKHGVTMPKQETYDEFLYRNIAKPYVDEVNNLVSDFNSIKAPDVSKYGDYSSQIGSYGQIAFKADKLKSGLEQLKKQGFTEQYSQLSKILQDIKDGADTNGRQIKNINDFYSSFEDENQYKLWVEEYKKEQKALNEDAGALQIELDNLNKVLSQAKKLQTNIDTYTKRGNTFKKRSGGLSTDGGNYSKANQYQNELDNILKTNGYSNISQLEKAVAEKEKYYKFVNNLQEKTRLSNVTNPESEFYDKDCEKYISMGKDYYESTHIKSPSLSDIPNVNFDQKNYNSDAVEKVEEYKNELFSFEYENMENEERRIYQYWLGKAVEDADGGEVNDEIAEKYVSYIKEAINYRRGQQVAKDADGNLFSQYVISAAGGIDGFVNDVKNTFDTESDYIPNSVLSYASQQVRKDLEDNSFKFWYNIKDGKWEDKAFGSSLGQIGHDLISNTSRMAIPMALSYVPFAGKYISLAATGVSAYGGAYKEKLNEGYSKEQARTYATMVGISEAALQYFLGGISKLGGKKSVSTAISNLVDKIDGVYTKAAVNLTLSAGAEGLEEGIQKFLEPCFHSLTTGETFEAPEWNEVLYDAFIGALSGAMIESSSVASEVKNDQAKSRIGSNIVKSNNVDSVLEAAEYLGKLDPEIAGQVKALKDFKDKATKGKSNKAYNRTLGKVAVTVAENASEVKHNIVESAVSNELKRRRVGADVINKVSKIVSKYIAGEKLSSSEQGYLKHNYVAATVMQEIKAAQEQIKAEAITSADAEISASTPSAPQWALDMVNSLSAVDSAVGIIKYAATGKTDDDEHQAEVNRMIKLLSIASGKTTAEQEAEAGDIPYEQYIKEKAKETAAQKENTAENSGETSPMENVDWKNKEDRTVVENGKQYSIKYPSFTAEELKQNAIHLQEMSPVKELTGNEFPKSDTPLQRRVLNFFNSIGNNVYSELFGDVALTNASVRDDLGHGRTNNKVVSFVAIPEVIKNGMVIDSQRRGGENYERIVVAAPIKIGNENFVMGVMLQRDFQSQRLYLHDVISINKEETMRNSETAPSSTEVSEKSNSLYMTNILQKALSVKKEYAQGEDNNTNEDSTFTGFSKVDVSEDNVTYESRLLHTMRGAKITTEGQAYIKRICQNLGIDVVFENVFTPKGNHADGYIDDNGVIHIDYHCSNPVEFVLKHELTHFGETSSLYKSFCKAVLSSDAFGEWISSKVEDGDTVTLKTALMREQISEFYKRNGVELSLAKQQNEMIANFVGEMLFSSDTNGLERLTTNMTVKEKKSVIDCIKSFIAHIKDKLSKVKNVSSEILSLERKFNELISTADKSKLADEGGKFSISEDGDGYYVKIDTSQEVFDGKSIQEQQDIAKKIIKDNFKGKVLAIGTKGSAYVNKNSAEEYAYPANRRMDVSIKESKMRAAPELDNLLAVSQFVGNISDDGRHPEATGGWDTYLTRFKIGNDMFKGEVKIKVTDRGYVFYDITKIEKLPVNGGQTVTNTAAASGSLSTDIIDDNSSSVNSNSMRESMDYSQEDISENGENTAKGSFSIPTATSEEVDSDIEAREAAQLTDFPDLMAILTDRRKRGEISEEDYMIEVRDLLDRANEKYGVIKQGELAENKMQLPKRVTEDKSAKTKRWVRTVHESGILPEDMEVQLEANILRDAMSYQIIDNATAQRQADTAIKRGTAENEWNAVVNGTGRIGKREIAIGETLLKLAAERKDSKTVMKLIAEVSEVGTRAGQVVQAMSMLKRMDGIGQLYYVKKTVDKINRDLDKRFGRRLKKGKIAEIPQVKINETLAEQLAASKTQEDFDITYEAMIKEIAEQLPSTFLDKWNAWRYFAMLFNPRTHIRNILGNYGFVPAVRTKDVLAAAIERVFLDESKYTKTAIVKKEYREFALKDFAEAENIITGSGKMNPSDEIRDKQAIFDTKWLEKLRKWNFDTLEKEDAMFLKKHYSHALGGFLQARNIDITKEIDSSVMEEARKYAIMEAQKATYRDSSAIVNVLQRTSHTKSQVWNSIVEGVLPFKKTPINIVRRGIEYSPIGLIKTLTKGTYDLVNGDITASQFIDGIAGGLTGTVVVVLGALLTSLGFINVTGGFDDDEEDDINRLLGRQEYAVEILGHSYTIDWMAPACIPFFIGVEIQNALEEKGNANLFQSIKNVTGSALEPIINLSMLSGMQDILSSARYSDGAAVVSSVLWNIALSYGSQALPSLSGAVARTIDGKRRTMYIDRNSWISDMGQMALNKIESKIPFATKLRSEYVDEFGRTEDNGNVFVRAIQNFISPGYYSKIEDDPVLEELKELYEQTGESVLPTKPKKYINVNGENKHLTADEYEEYAAEVGQERYDYVKELFGSSQAKTLSYEEKRKVISDLYSYALAKGKTHYSDYKLPDLYEKAYEAEKNGISPVDYYLSKIATNVENADTDGSGTVTKNERLAAIYKMNVSNDIKAALIALYS